MISFPRKISKEDFIEILLDKELIRDDVLLIFQTMYSLKSQRGRRLRRD